MPNKQESGFTLIELMLAVTFGALILAIMSPELSRGRVAANERAALATLRSIPSAQAQLASSAAIDSDGGPAYDAALSDMRRDPNAVTGMAARLGTPPGQANDGNLWTRIGR